MKYFIVFAIAFLLGIVVNSKKEGLDKYLFSKEKQSFQHQWINPLLDCDFAFQASPQILSLKKRISSFIKKQKREKNISNASVYFKDLSNGPTFSINQEKKYISSSLLKVPVMMAYLLRSEQEEDLLTRNVIYRPIKERPYYSFQNFVPKKRLVEGNSYAIEELLYYMIVFSDNNALDALMQYWPTINVDTLLSNLGVELMIENHNAFIDVRSYSILFRVLYNATFLDLYNSNYALSILVNSQLNEGLREGVPETISIARKFGESSDGNSYQFHDCGIVYYPRRPYLLCVMTESKKSFIKSLNVVEEVSRLIFNEISMETRL